MAASKGWDLFHIDLKTVFLQGQSYDVKRDVVCQLPPEAGHPPNIAARLKKPAYGMNDAPDAGGTSLIRHWAAVAWFPHEPIDAVTCYVIYSRVGKRGNTGYKGLSPSRTVQKTPSLNRVMDYKWKLHLKKWIPELEVQLQEDPWQKSTIYLWMIFLEQVETQCNNAF